MPCSLGARPLPLVEHPLNERTATKGTHGNGQGDKKDHEQGDKRPVQMGMPSTP